MSHFSISEFLMPMRFKFILLLCLFISGCATYATGPRFTAAPPGPVDTGTLYVFRARPSIASGMPVVKLNGEPVVRLPAMGYSYVYLRPGVYTVTFERGPLKYFTTDIDIHPKEDIFLELQEPAGTGSAPAIAREQYHYVQPLKQVLGE